MEVNEKLMYLLQQREQYKAIVRELEVKVRELEEVKEFIEKYELNELYEIKGNLLFKRSKEEILNEINKNIEILKIQIDRYLSRLEDIEKKISELKK